MEDKTEKRKAAFVKASSATLAEFEKDIFFDSESGKHEGDLLAAKIATGLLGLMAIDVIESYESLAESGLPESVREAKLLTDIFNAALFTAIDVFASTLRFVGKQGESLYSAAVDVLSEKLSEIEEADRPDWDDVPQEVLEHIASEAGVTIEQLKEGYSFRAVNLMDGTPVKRSDLNGMDLENTVFESNIRNRGEETAGNCDDESESMLDDFINGMD